MNGTDDGDGDTAPRSGGAAGDRDGTPPRHGPSDPGRLDGQGGVPIGSRRAVLFGLTFAVAFCSIAYELVYAELLRVFFGGTVTQYALNIGLFLFGFGFGSFLYEYVDRRRVSFTHVEAVLAAAGPLGLVFIVGLNVADPVHIAFGEPTRADPRLLVWTVATLPYVLSYVPVLLVGALSGLEVPYLTDLADADDRARADGEGTPPRSPVGRLVEGATTFVPFLVVPDESERGNFSRILGMDYIGSLAGTVVYALVLYPTIGLVSAVFVLGFINAVAAVVFFVRFRVRSVDSVADLVLLRFAGGRRAVFLVCLVLTGLYAGVVVENERFEGTITEVYVEGRMTTEWPSHDMRFEVLDHRTTRYQEVTLYERTWTGERDEWWGDRTDTCLRLDGQLQLCDSWVGAYHTGLVDVPAAFYGNDLSGKDVLVVGGGDWIAVDHLRRYNASVTLVDLDREFLEYTKDHPYFEQYHDDAYRYDRLRVVVADALTYLRETNRTFDMVVFDGPGIEEDKLLGLYSVEFFRLARRHLAEGGVFVTWAYSPYAHGRHNKVYLNTVRAAGFTRMYSYRSYVDADADDESETVEYFYAFTAGSTPEGRFNASPVASVRARAAQYARNEWRPVPRFDGVDPNSIFDPNYAIIVK